VGGSSFAVAPVGQFADHPGQAARRAGSAEDRGEERVLDRPLPRPLLGLALREVPHGAVRMWIEHLLRYGGPVIGIEVGAPAGDPCPQLLAGLGVRRFLLCVGHGDAPVRRSRVRRAA
jgi:hypothetical protein